MFHERLLVVGSRQNHGAIGDGPVVPMGVPVGGLVVRASQFAWHRGLGIRVHVVIEVFCRWPAPE